MGEIADGWMDEWVGEQWMKDKMDGWTDEWLDGLDQQYQSEAQVFFTPALLMLCHMPF